MTAKEIIESGNFRVSVEMMDDDIREAVHADLSPCSDEDFLAEYMRRHYDKYMEEFVVE